MSTEDLNHRIRRIYASIDALEKADLSKFPPNTIDKGDQVGFLQDFTGGLSEEELANTGYVAVHNIANLQGHLRQWTVRNVRDKSRVDAVFRGSRALQLVQDLSNNDKHGYPPRDGGYSGIGPRIVGFERVMRLTTKAEAGSSVIVVATPQGPRQASGSGTARVLITGDVVDKDGNAVGDLYEVGLEAVETWEELLKEFELGLTSSDRT